MAKIERKVFLCGLEFDNFFSCSFQGISIKPLVRFLQINLQEEKDLKLSEEINTHVSHDIPEYVYTARGIYSTFDRGIINYKCKIYNYILHVLHVLHVF